MAAIGLAVLGELAVRRPLAAQFRALDEEIARRTETLERNLRTTSPAVRRAVLSDYQNYGERIRKRASTAEESAAMLSVIEETARQSGVGLSSTKPREPKIASFSEEYAVEVEVETDMKSLIAFLRAIESSGQLLRVPRLTLDGSGAGQRGRLKGVLTVTKAVTL
jgi:Tfp pilus assembly protein PilO